jgi:hemerythrin
MGTPFVWRDDFLVSFPAIDQEHREIVSRAGELHAAVAASRPNSELHQHVASLFDFTEKHFTAEEKLMLESGYTGYAAHKSAHRDLLGQLSVLREAIAAGTVNPSHLLQVFIEVWVEQHMVREDKALAGFLNRTGSSGYDRTLMR